jgi:hypothetical protein
MKPVDGLLAIGLQRAGLAGDDGDLDVLGLGMDEGGCKGGGSQCGHGYPSATMHGSLLL